MLTVNNIEVVYSDVILVLKGLSLTCEEGKITTLLGANGAGKSTTLKAISGLLKSEEGEVTKGDIEFLGEKINGMDPEKIVRKGIFQVMEGRRVFEDLDIVENLRCGAYTRSDRAGVKRDIDLVFDYFPILKERRNQLSGYLSGGEQQMLAIGRALMSQPKFLMLDEPSLGLAPLLVKTIFEKIVEINRERGLTILLVEQNANRALEISHFGYVLETGKITLAGDSAALRQNPQVRSAYLGG